MNRDKKFLSAPAFLSGKQDPDVYMAKKEKKVKKMEEKRRKTEKKEHAQRGKPTRTFPTKNLLI